jgi:hypothetical protein
MSVGWQTQQFGDTEQDAIGLIEQISSGVEFGQNDGRHP